MDVLIGLAILLLVPWLLLCGFTGYVASQKNRSAVSWFCLALLFTPILALLGLCAVPVRADRAVPTAGRAFTVALVLGMVALLAVAAWVARPARDAAPACPDVEEARREVQQTRRDLEAVERIVVEAGLARAATDEPRLRRTAEAAYQASLEYRATLRRALPLAERELQRIEERARLLRCPR